MKKLAMALMCLVSLAFFASCNPEGAPTIQVLSEDGYVQNGDIVNLGEEVNFGFVMSSAIETGSPLASLVIKIDDNDPDTIALTGSNYTYRGTLVYGLEKEEIVGYSTLIATVYDAVGQYATTSLTFSLNQPAQDLVVRDFEWYRLGNTITGLDEFGLEWKGNYPKDNYAKIVPQEGVKLFVFTSEDWANVKTDVEKAAFFNTAIETMHSVEEYWEVNVTQMDMEYDHVIGTVLADGTCHLIHVTSSHSASQPPQGTATTIYGEAK